MGKTDIPKFRIFFSSPGDVQSERYLADEVVKRLQAEFADRAYLEPIFWEHEPLRATAHFQEQIPRPSQTDLVVVILWSRFGTRLPPGVACRPDGSHYMSGTEYEFEDAIGSHRERGVPDLLVYRKTAVAMTELDSEELVLERLSQKRALDSFIGKWFSDESGSFKAAFHTFETPAGFEEILEKHLKKLLEEKFPLSLDDPPPPPRFWKDAPFRGLEYFDVEHAPIFCGRTAACDDVLGILRRQAAAGRAFALIVGASGLGKSSLMRSGVLPRLIRPGEIEGIGLWKYAIFRPSDSKGSLVRGLAFSLLREMALPNLAGRTVDSAELTRLLAEEPDTAAEMIKDELLSLANETAAKEDLASPPLSRLALAVDQFEEIFTIEGQANEDRLQFIRALDALARSGVVWIMASVRSDFYAACSEIPELMSLKKDGQYDLKPPTPAEITQMIRRPLMLSGLRFESKKVSDEQLDDVIRDSAKDNPEALPLLEFTLDELYRRRSPEGEITFSAYRELGRLEGALAKRAEEVFQSLSSKVQDCFGSVFAGLTALQQSEKDRVVRRRVTLDRLANTPERLEFVQIFIKARLFVADREDDGTASVSIAHEAIYKHWERLQHWLKEDREFLLARARLTSRAAEWRGEERSPDYLLPEGAPLKEAKKWLDRRRDDFSAEVVEYIEASLKAGAGRKRRRTLLATSGLSLLVFISLFALVVWDTYFRMHETFCANFTWRNGAMECVGEISSSMQKQRNRTYKFYTRGGKTLNVEILNGSGTLVENDEGEAVFEHHYDRADRVSEIVVKNRHGKRLERKVLTFTRNIVDITSLDRFDRPKKRKKSEVSRERVTLDKNGFEIHALYMNSYGTPKPNEEGFVAAKQENDERGLWIKLDVFDSNDQPMSTNSGIGGVTVKYDSLGNEIEYAFFGVDGEPTLQIDGVAGWRSKFDEKGNKIESAFFGVDGKPTLIDDGYAIWRSKFDEKGNEIEIAFFGVDGKPILHKEGYAIWRSKFDEKGNETQRTSFGVDGKPILIDDGYAIWRSKFDAKGNKIENAFFGVDGEPILDKNGVAGWRSKFDEKGNQVERAFFGVDGEPILIDDGYAGWRSKFDEKGNKIESAFFGVDGKPTLIDDGYAIWRSKFDEKGNEVESSFFGVDGKPILHKEGYAIWRSKFDEKGNEIESAFFGVDGERTLQIDGVAVWRSKFDEKGNKIESAYFGVDGKPTLHKVGVAVWRSKFDEKGNKIEIAYFGVDGKPTLIDDGYAVWRSKFDEKGNEIESAYFGVDGKPILHKEGNAVWRSKFDEKGNEIERAFFGVDGEPTLQIDGVAGWRAKFDEKGNETQRTSFGVDGKPILVAEGFAGWRSKFDEKGNQVERAFFGVDGKPILIDDGYAIWRSKFDAKGNKIENAFFGVDGKPILIDDGYAIWRSKFDAKGNKIERAFFGVDGERTLQIDGVAGWRSKFDEKGNEIERAFFGVDGEPILIDDGYAGWRSKFDAKRNEIEREYFGVDGRPTLDSNGIAGYLLTRDVKNTPSRNIDFNTEYEPIQGWFVLARGFINWKKKADQFVFQLLNGKPVSVPKLKALLEERLKAYLISFRAELLRRTNPELFFNARGVLVTFIGPDSQAEAAGVKPGDILLKYNGTKLNSVHQAIATIEEFKGEQAELIVLRDGKHISFTMKPGKIGVMLEPQ